MQERHIDRKRYFEEQAQTSEKYYLPYVKGKGTIEELLSIKKTRCTIEMLRIQKFINQNTYAPKTINHHTFIQ